MFIWLIKTERPTGRITPTKVIGGFKITSSVSARTIHMKEYWWFEKYT